MWNTASILGGDALPLRPDCLPQGILVEVWQCPSRIEKRTEMHKGNISKAKNPTTAPCGNLSETNKSATAFCKPWSHLRFAKINFIKETTSGHCRRTISQDGNWTWLLIFPPFIRDRVISLIGATIHKIHKKLCSRYLRVLVCSGCLGTTWYN